MFTEVALLISFKNFSPAFKAELRQWMRYNRKHQDETADGLSYAVFGAPNLPRFMAEFMHMSDPAAKRWIQERLESVRGRFSFSAEQKKRILERLTAAE